MQQDTKAAKCDKYVDAVVFFLSKSPYSLLPPPSTEALFRFSNSALADSSLKIMKIEFNSLVRPNYNYVNGTYYLFIFFSPLFLLFVFIPGLWGESSMNIVAAWHRSCVCG